MGFQKNLRQFEGNFRPLRAIGETAKNVWAQMPSFSGR